MRVLVCVYLLAIFIVISVKRFELHENLYDTLQHLHLYAGGNLEDVACFFLCSQNARDDWTKKTGDDQDEKAAG